MRTIGWITTLTILAGSFSFVGCGAVGGGKTVVKYDEGVAPVETKVPTAGSYALYSTTDYNPRIVVALQQSDTIGFRKTDNGNLIAVAGNREVPLEANHTYYWKRQ